MTVMPRLRSFALALTIGLAGLPALAGDVLLTVTGPAGTHEYDLTSLEALPGATISTKTIWTEGQQEFTGVPLAALLKDAGIGEGSVTATAINDYAVEIPLAEITEEYPIVAYKQNGAAMSVRDKGPLWIIYPYDSSDDYQSEVVYSRSIWQLDRLSATN